MHCCQGTVTAIHNHALSWDQEERRQTQRDLMFTHVVLRRLGWACERAGANRVAVGRRYIRHGGGTMPEEAV